MHTDWSSPDLRAAAVEFLLQQCGPRPRSSGTKERSDWSMKFQEVAQSLGMKPGAEISALHEWFEDPAYRPDLDSECGGSRPETAGVADDAAVLEKCAETVPAPNIPEGALPSRPEESLTDLLREESTVLDAAEREEIARALDRGDGLTRQQCRAVALILRAADASSKADIVRAVIDFLIPSGSEERHAWVVKDRMLTLRAGETIEARFCAVRISGFPVLGQSCLVVRSASGSVVQSLLYARVRKEEGPRVRYRQLVPVKSFAKDQVAQNLALLADMVRPQNAKRDGKAWGALFGISKQLVSYHRKNLAAKIAERSGARSSVRAPGLRSKPHKTKGVRKT